MRFLNAAACGVMLVGCNNADSLRVMKLEEQVREMNLRIKKAEDAVAILAIRQDASADINKRQESRLNTLDGGKFD